MVYPQKAFHPINIFMPGYFIYCRKSSEAEDRQILSNESQNRELAVLGVNRHLPISRIFSESKSAKEPGRPVFNEMMQAVYRGEAAGIICWKLDRLARNPVDGGSVIWAIKQQGIKVITPSQTYGREDDNSILMYMEFGFAQKYVDDLSKNTKRGLKTKVENGWYPGVAPVGYLNYVNKQTGERTLIRDEELFPQIRRMWDLMLTGLYTPPRILEIANDEWGFRTRSTRRMGGNPLSKSGIYHIFKSSFYYGWFEYPKGSGRTYWGKHEPMITEAEYRRVQTLLGRTESPRPQSHREFAFTGLIRCGDCGRMVTAEEKRQVRCGKCRFKFAYRKRDSCPRCQTPVKDMAKSLFRTYTYYHCAKSTKPACRQSSVTAQELERQIEGFLARIQISKRFKDWAIKYLHELRAKESASQTAIVESQQRAYQLCSQRLDALVKLKTSPDNADGSLLSDEEYSRQRMEILKERSSFENMLRDGGKHLEERIELAEQAFELAYTARVKFTKGDAKTKRQILSAIQSNLLLKDKKLNIEARIPFSILANSLSPPASEDAPIEPENTGLQQRQNEGSACASTRRLRVVDDVRTSPHKSLCKSLLTYSVSSKENVHSPLLSQNSTLYFSHPKSLTLISTTFALTSFLTITKSPTLIFICSLRSPVCSAFSASNISGQSSDFSPMPARCFNI